MDIGRPKRKITIEPIRDPVPRERPVEQPVEPVRVAPAPERVAP